jgi:hypothetical protein
MRWDAHEIARFARRAGFVPPQVVEATAVALATSGGIASYDHQVGAPGVGHYIGLWGIDVDRHQEYADTDLWVPHVNARVAHDLTVAYDGFGWSPVHQGGHHLRDMPYAGTESTREMATQRAGQATGTEVTSHLLTQASRRFADVHRICAGMMNARR